MCCICRFNSQVLSISGAAMPIPPSKYKEDAARRELKQLLREWYGERDGNLAITAHDKPVKTLDELNKELLQNALPKNLNQQIELAARWKEIVSPQFAALVNFSSLDDDGVLFLEIRHSAFLQDELAKSSDLLLNRINSQMGSCVCKEIRFVPSGRSSFRKSTELRKIK